MTDSRPGGRLALLLISCFLFPFLGAGQLLEYEVRRVTQVLGRGVLSCVINPGNDTTPDLSLDYDAVYVFPSGTEIECHGDFSPEIDETGTGVIHCIYPECPEVEPVLLDVTTVLVVGYNNETEIEAAAEADIQFQSVTPTATELGGGVVEVKWAPLPNRSYKVQLSAGPARWYREEDWDYEDYDFNGDDDESEEMSDEEEEEEEEEENEEWKTSYIHPRILEALKVLAEKDPHLEHLSYARILQEVVNKGTPKQASRNPDGPPSHFEERAGPLLSDVLSCEVDLCQYYFLNVPSSGVYFVDVLDVTDSVVYATRTADEPLLAWGNLTITEVRLASDTLNPDPALRPKTLSARVQPTGGTLDQGFTALVVNGEDQTQAAESVPEECLPESTGCLVRGVDSLLDPDTGVPATDFYLLLTQADLALSSLIPVADVGVVAWETGVGGLARVEWSRVGGLAEGDYSARVVAWTDGAAVDPVTLACNSTGCWAEFSALEYGNYTAEVEYTQTVLTVAATGFVITDGAPQQCELPFVSVGDRCVAVETIATGTWAEMNNFCHQLGGQLVSIKTDNFFYYLIQFINDNGLNLHDYWIGASDQAVEDSFVWLDGSEVKRGTPFWGYTTLDQEPTGGSAQNCVLLSKTIYFFFSDASCTTVIPAICEAL